MSRTIAVTPSRPHTTLRPGVFHRLADALALWRQRRLLAELPPERLDDIGLTLDEARREAARPIWDVPSHWLR